MKIININKEQLINLLLNKNYFSKGSKGILTLKNDKLSNIYFNDFINTYYKNNQNLLDDEVKSLRIKKNISKNPKRKFKVLKRLSDTKSNNLITGLLSYKGILVGIEMNYLKDYITLEKALSTIPYSKFNEFVDICYKKCEELIDDLLKQGIIPYDIHEENILVNMNTNDFQLIDLDDESTKYMSKKYVLKHSYICNEIKHFYNMRESIEEIEFFRMNSK